MYAGVIQPSSRFQAEEASRARADARWAFVYACLRVIGFPLLFPAGLLLGAYRRALGAVRGGGAGGT